MEQTGIQNSGKLFCLTFYRLLYPKRKGEKARSGVGVAEKPKALETGGAA
jgi:hypothetical protein